MSVLKKALLHIPYAKESVIAIGEEGGAGLFSETASFLEKEAKTKNLGISNLKEKRCRQLFPQSDSVIAHSWGLLSANAAVRLVHQGREQKRGMLSVPGTHTV